MLVHYPAIHLVLLKHERGKDILSRGSLLQQLVGAHLPHSYDPFCVPTMEILNDRAAVVNEKMALEIMPPDTPAMCVMFHEENTELLLKTAKEELKSESRSGCSSKVAAVGTAEFQSAVVTLTAMTEDEDVNPHAI